MLRTYYQYLEKYYCFIKKKNEYFVLCNIQRYNVQEIITSLNANKYN